MTTDIDPATVISDANRWLDRGDRKKIAKNTGTPYTTVCRIFRGEIRKKRHFRVLAEANRMIKEYQAYFA